MVKISRPNWLTLPALFIIVAVVAMACISIKNQTDVADDAMENPAIINRMSREHIKDSLNMSARNVPAELYAGVPLYGTN